MYTTAYLGYLTISRSVLTDGIIACPGGGVLQPPRGSWRHEGEVTHAAGLPLPPPPPAYRLPVGPHPGVVALQRPDPKPKS